MVRRLVAVPRAQEEHILRHLNPSSLWTLVCSLHRQTRYVSILHHADKILIDKFQNYTSCSDLVAWFQVFFAKDRVTWAVFKN